MTPWQLEFLSSHRVGHLATASAEAAPHVIPVCYALDSQGVCFMADGKPKRGPAREILRLRNLRENPRAALVVDDYDDQWEHLAWVMVRGPAVVVEEGYEACLELLRLRYPQYREMELHPGQNPIVRIGFGKVTGWRYREEPAVPRCD